MGVSAWHSNTRLLGELHRGDCLWFVTWGKNPLQAAEQAGFLVAVWQVQEVVERLAGPMCLRAKKWPRGQMTRLARCKRAFSIVFGRQGSCGQVRQLAR